MKRVNIDKLLPGDIILTASATKAGKVVRFSTGGIVSHAMICVQHGSIIDSTANGVQAGNLQRQFFDDDESVFAFRMREELRPSVIAKIVDFARAEIGTRYSTREAVRTVTGGSRPRSERQFCSRLVARAFGSVGIELVADRDYCSPEDLRLSPLLYELENITEEVVPDEVASWASRPDPIQATQDAHNAVLAVARRLDRSVENFNDLAGLVLKHPEWDTEIAQAYQTSGYLDIWKQELHAHPYRYDLSLMETISEPGMLVDLRAYCIATIQEAYSGGVRFAVNLTQYRAMQAAGGRKTFVLLIHLYEILVRLDQRRRETARSWLLCHHPEDVAANMERVLPHSELWFSIVDRVEPALGAIARLSIERERSAEVCSSCGDPARDYRLSNAAEAMPGVPSLRLCKDCVAIRRGCGENLDVMD